MFELSSLFDLAVSLPALAADAPAQAPEAPAMLKFLNDNEGAVQAVSVIFYILTTLVFILATFRSNKLARDSQEEMRKMHQEEMRPRVIFDILVKPGDPVHVHLQNIGRTPARNVKLNLTQDVTFGRDDDKRKLMDLNFLQSTESLAPDRNIRSLIAWRPDLFLKENEGKIIKGTISYADLSGQTYTEDISIDVEDYVMVTDVLKKNMDDLVRAVEELSKTWQRGMR